MMRVVRCAKLSLFPPRYLESGFLELALQWNFVELVDVLMQAGAHLKKIDDT